MNPIPEINQTAVLQQRVRNAGSWMYWIAGLTMVTVIIALCGSG